MIANLSIDRSLEKTYNQKLILGWIIPVLHEFINFATSSSFLFTIICISKSLISVPEMNAFLNNWNCSKPKIAIISQYLIFHLWSDSMSILNKCDFP